MVRFLKRGHSFDKPEQDIEMSEIAARQAHSLILESEGGGNGPAAEDIIFHDQGVSTGHPLEGHQIGSALDCSSGEAPRSRSSKHGGPPSDMELMKERFARLLLGEDMSGGGKGVSSALALSNAITNLAASVFGEQGRLEPMSAERKEKWGKEIDWLLSVADHIVEFVPSHQTSKDGFDVEIMVTQQRKDLQMNIPALRKLDAMLVGFLDNFKDQNEFWYVSRDADDESERGSAQRRDDKWWHPKVVVPPNGLSEVSRRWLQLQKESANQVLKAAMAINAQVLMEMEVPEAYIESLPRNGRASLGDAIYRSITVDVFHPEQFLESMDLSTEHKVLDLKNRIEASIVIWKRKMHSKDGKSTWGSAVTLEKRELLEERAETILHLIKQRFPGIPQSALEISKIQYNRDVGQSILEGYSRILESLAYTIMSRIEDVLYADALAQDPSSKDPSRRQSLSDAGAVSKLDPEELEKLKEAASLMIPSDFMGCHCFELGSDTEEKPGNLEDILSSQDKLERPPNITAARKFCYVEKVEHVGGLRSPTARH